MTGDLQGSFHVFLIRSSKKNSYLLINGCREEKSKPGLIHLEDVHTIGCTIIWAWNSGKKSS